MSIFLLLLFTNGVASEVTCDSYGSCGCQISGGEGILDLSPLMTDDQPPMFKNLKIVGEGQISVNMDLCKKFSCASTPSYSCYYPMLAMESPLGVQRKTVYDPTNDEVKFIYTNPGGGGQTLSTTYISMHCSSDTSSHGKLSDFTEKPEGSFNFYATFDSQYACLKKSKDTHKHGLGTGSLLCILLLVFVVLYIALGIVINKYVRKLERPDWFPNRTFWSDFPSLVKNGTVFFISKTCKRKNSEYEQI